MIEVRVPKDINTYEATLIGPFTTRQVICISIAAVLEYVYYTIIQFLSLPLSTDTFIGIGVVLAIPIMAFAFIKPNGLRLERYLKSVFVLSVLAPKVRIYKSINIFDPGSEPVIQDNKTKQKQFTAGELKAHPEYIMYQ